MTDVLTGLHWERTVSTSTFDRPGARAYCDGLTLGGLTGWRLPTVIELESIVSYGAHSPAVDTAAFPNTPADFFWSASANSGDANRGWVVSFDDGYASPASFWVDRWQVRCVQSEQAPSSDAGAPPGRFSTTEVTVFDTFTSLTWERTPDQATYTLAGANSHCQSLDLGGGGWRLPRLKELQSLVDVRRPISPALDGTAFINPRAVVVWSSTGRANAPGGVWAVDFGSGTSVSTFQPSTPGVSARCVR